MAKTPLQIFQFKIKLCGIKAMIWRRVQIPSSSTFEDLHYTIQGAMGWESSHLHEFVMPNPQGLLAHIGSAEEFNLQDVRLDLRK